MCTVLLLLPFVDFQWIQKNTDFLQLLGLTAAFTVSGIPLGWFLYQIYDAFLHKQIFGKRAWKKPRQILKSWDKEGKTCRQFRDTLMDYALLKSGLRTLAGLRWSHASSRSTTGLLVPVVSPSLAIALFLLAQLTRFSAAFHLVNIQLSFLISGTIWFVTFAILLLVVFLKTCEILGEIQDFITISLIEEESEIKKIMSNPLADRKWSPIKSQINKT